MDIKLLRGEMDEVNVGILRLFERRMELSRSIAEYKAEKGLPVCDERREKEIIKYVSSISENDTREYAVELFRTLMRFSREYQSNLTNNRRQ